MTKLETGSRCGMLSCHLGKSISRHNSVTYRPIRIKMCRPMPNHMPMTTVGLKSKPEVQGPNYNIAAISFQNRNISMTAVD